MTKMVSIFIYITKTVSIFIYAVVPYIIDFLIDIITWKDNHSRFPCPCFDFFNIMVRNYFYYDDSLITTVFNNCN